MHLLRLAYTYCWVHESLRLHAIGTGHRWAERTLAMAAGLTDRPYSLGEVLRMPAHPLPFPPPAAPTGRSAA